MKIYCETYEREDNDDQINFDVIVVDDIGAIHSDVGVVNIHHRIEKETGKFRGLVLCLGHLDTNWSDIRTIDGVFRGRVI